MNCEEFQTLLHAYLDGELDAARSVELERHVADCPQCKQALQNQTTLKRAITSSATYYKAPVDLRRWIFTATQTAATAQEPRPETPQAQQTPQTQHTVIRWKFSPLAAGLAMAACLALGFFIAIGLKDNAASRGLIVDELTSAHVRSLLATHLMDVISTDQHTVKPWFDGKIDFAPPVPKLDAKGYPLLGGRLDYIGGHTVAALVYKKEKHFINLFIWPAPGGDYPPRDAKRNGYNLVNWSSSGMTFWAVSDTDPASLHDFAATTGTAPAEHEK